MNPELINRLKKLAADRTFTMRAALGGIALISALLSVFLVENFFVLTSAELFVQDFEISRLAPPAPQDPNIVVMAVNEETLEGLPYRSPVDRVLLSDLLRSLAAKHPRAIALDFVLDQPTEPAKDALLKQTIRDLKVPLFISFPTQTAVVTAKQSAYLNAFVPPKLRVDPTLAEDQFGTVRQISPGVKSKDGKYLIGFARAIAASAGVNTPDKIVPIIWHGQPGNNVPAFIEYAAQAAKYLPEAWFKGKIILVGSDLSLTDRHRTPYATSLNAFLSRIIDVAPNVKQSAAISPEGILPGIVIHAHSVAQFLEHTPSPYPAWWESFLIAFVFAVVGGVLGILNYHLLPRIGIGIGILLALWLGGAALYHAGGPIISLLTPTLSTIMCFGAMDSLSGRDARKQRQFIQNAFSRYVSPKVVEALVADPERMSLQGERRVMTYIFTDIKDSTTFSEKIDSRELAPLLNAYFEGITQLILRYEGMVDKFIGDAVFAIFNAPVDLPDHAERAVRCAMEIEDFTQAFCKSQKGNSVGFGYTRIGVHTGTAVVGNFGSQTRFNYTAQGDAVNVAARLEGLNKHLGTRLCVSGATRDLCANIPFRPIASVVLKGKTTPIDVWEPLRAGAKPQGFLERYDIAFRTLQRGGAEAGAMFDTLADEAPDDPCVRLHHERLRKGAKGVDVLMEEK
ncbi:MAG TPA: adenylate/guanylate cyclase domain-containing protein [Rhizomicrobium sp.]|jgi:class 3 adenylate cyclase|nr:adenylate/guanylate cyclase domain-containing protein [Rhizomicrobium sp.]